MRVICNTIRAHSCEEQNTEGFKTYGILGYLITIMVADRSNSCNMFTFVAMWHLWQVSLVLIQDKNKNNNSIPHKHSVCLVKTTSLCVPSGMGSFSHFTAAKMSVHWHGCYCLSSHYTHYYYMHQCDTLSEMINL